MMRTRIAIYFIWGVLLWLSIPSYAQTTLNGQATYRVELRLRQNRGFSNCNGGGGIGLIRLIGNSNITIHEGSRIQFVGEERLFTADFSAPNAINYIRIDASSRRNDSRPFIDCRGTDYHDDRRIYLNNRTCYRTLGDLAFQHPPDDIAYEASVFPFIEIDNPSTNAFLTNDEFLTINLPNNLDPSYYNWEYAINIPGSTPVFRRFPDFSNGRQTNNVPRLRIRGDEFLSDADFGRVILIRANPRCGWGRPSNTIALEYLKSVPRITRTPTQNVSCYDTTDGSVRLFFDGPLDPNAQGINISITDLSNRIGTDASGNPIYAVIGNINNIRAFDSNNSILVPNLRPSVPGFRTRIELLGRGYFTDATNHRADVTIGRPDYVEFSITEVIPVSCFDGEDGAIALSADGGTGRYEYTYSVRGSGAADQWRAFSGTSTHTIGGLTEGIYEVKVRDTNDCEAKEVFTNPSTGVIALGAVITETREIIQPGAPLEVRTEILNQPTAFGFEDGRIQATITGGTPLSGNRYAFEWKDKNNNVLSTTTAVYNEDQGYLVTLHSIGTGEYQITVRDANYTTAVGRRNTTTNTRGCIATSEFEPLIAPPPLQVRIEETRPISCNNGNEYSDQIDTNLDTVPDQFQDGELTAFATGGVPFDTTTPDFTNPFPTDDNGNFIPYYFNWERQLADGTWVAVPQNGPRITFLSTANYALNITDRNGIILGTYRAITLPDGSRAYELDTRENETRFLPQPEQLTLRFETTSPNCVGGNDASARVVVSGGIPPYTYRWNTGATTAAIENIIGGKYLVFITDSRGCQLEGRVTIDQPGGIEITPITITNPTCVGYDDGVLSVSVSGGTPPYRYQWVSGSSATTPNLTSIPQGTYRLRITDANDCTAFYEETLVDPPPVLIDLGPDRTLCVDQSVTLDSSISDPLAQYSWTSDTGFSSTDPIVTLTESGIYTVTATTSLGCIGTDTIVITVSDAVIDADFLLTSQAFTGEEVILVNVSTPIGERVEWLVPETVRIVSETQEAIQVVFPAEGAYDITLRSHQGDCFQEDHKTILVEPAIEGPEVFTQQGAFIQEFIPFPNPTQGDFSVRVLLAEEANATLKIMSLTQGVINERTERQIQDHIAEYRENLPPGVYLILLETPKGSETRKLVIE